MVDGVVVVTAVLWGLGFGFGVAAWRQIPPIEPAPARGGLVLLALVALFLAFRAGRAEARGGGASATATAVATAGAVATGGAGGQVIVNVGLDQLQAVAWRQPAGTVDQPAAYVAALDELGGGDELDALDPVEVIEHAESGSLPLALVIDERSN